MMIQVNRPYLPPLEEYTRYVEQIWSRNWLTNNGPLVCELEKKLREYLGVQHMVYVSNGTIAIQIAIRALDITGEIITTPFSYVATTSSISWQGCKPVFVDIDPKTLTIDPNEIKKAITPRTQAILATHVFGNACDIDAIDAIARQHGLRVIYDAAHCFGTTYKGKSIFGYGDISTASFHATKLFHTIEGGAIFTRDTSLLEKVDYMRNFGHSGPGNFVEIGINGKNSEFHAAMGLVNLNHIQEILLSRKEQSARYDKQLKALKSQPLAIQEGCTFNYAYYPVLFPTESAAMEVMRALESNQVFPRRYFYPSLNTVALFGNGPPLRVSESASKRILCLPLYHSLSREDIDRIAEICVRASSSVRV